MTIDTFLIALIVAGFAAVIWNYMNSWQLRRLIKRHKKMLDSADALDLSANTFTHAGWKPGNRR